MQHSSAQHCTAQYVINSNVSRQQCQLQVKCTWVAMYNFSPFVFLLIWSPLASVHLFPSHHLPSFPSYLLPSPPIFNVQSFSFFSHLILSYFILSYLISTRTHLLRAWLQLSVFLLCIYTSPNRWEFCSSSGQREIQPSSDLNKLQL